MPICERQSRQNIFVRSVAMLVCALVSLLVVHCAAENDRIRYNDAMRGRFVHKSSCRPHCMCLLKHRAGTGNEVDDWTQWLKEAKQDVPEYPEGRCVRSCVDE
jgi:hypothetical protein